MSKGHIILNKFTWYWMNRCIIDIFFSILDECFIRFQKVTSYWINLDISFTRYWMHRCWIHKFLFYFWCACLNLQKVHITLNKLSYRFNLPAEVYTDCFHPYRQQKSLNFWIYRGQSYKTFYRRNLWIFVIS